MQIKNDTATSILINNAPLDENKEYTIALLDYVANGGDDAVMLRGIPQANKGYRFRDIILKYMEDQQKQGKKISAQVQQRVTYAVCQKIL